MASKFYVVWAGKKPGIYTDWTHCKQQVEGFKGARYKSFKTNAEASAAFKGESLSASSSTHTTKRPASNKAGIKTYSPKEVAELKADVKLFTDGGCEPNPGEAGSGIALYRNDILDSLFYGLYDKMGTNNTAELLALFHAMKHASEAVKAEHSVIIFSDSKYSIQCICQWAVGWQKKGWKKSGGEIKNLELIKTMFTLYLQLKDYIQILHVNGHVGLEGNELADRMSMVAIEEKQVDLIKYKQELNVDSILALRRG
jgi:ribonuclease HI